VAPGAPHIRVQPRSSGAHPGNPSVSRQRRKEKKFAGRVITTRSRSSPSRVITDRASPTSFQTQAMSNPYGGANQFMYPGYMVRALPPTPVAFKRIPQIFVNECRRKRKFHPHFFLTPTPRHPPEPFLSSGIKPVRRRRERRSEGRDRQRRCRRLHQRRGRHVARASRGGESCGGGALAPPPPPAAPAAPAARSGWTRGS
jgi:hypothetical protein